MPRSQMEAVLNWINYIAENQKLGVPILEIIILIKIPYSSRFWNSKKNGFDEFVNAINSLDPDYISERQTKSPW